MTPLRQRMIEDMQAQLRARHSKGHIANVAAVARYFGKSPDQIRANAA
jgi:hypothetical protein